MDLATYLRRTGTSLREFAALAGVSHESVRLWAAEENDDKVKITMESVIKIEAATGGKVTRRDLRPDLFHPAPPRRRRGCR